MTHGAPHEAERTLRSRVAVRVTPRAIAMFAISALFLGAAVWAVVAASDSMPKIGPTLRDAPVHRLALLVALPLVNWLLTSLTFWVLTTRYGKVALSEMAGLIASAWLLNMLPTRPGLIGRIAYHKSVNKIRVRDSAKVIGHAMLASIAGIALLLVALVGAHALAQGGQPSWLGLVVIGAPCVMLPACGLAMRARTHLDALAWRLIAATGVRYADTLVWAIRYWIVFELVGRPVSLEGAGLIAAISQAAMVVPFQFGFREWVVGAFSGLFPDPGSIASTTQGLVDQLAPGLLADVINRAAELVCVIPLGLAASIWLWRRRYRMARTAQARTSLDESGPGPD